MAGDSERCCQDGLSWLGGISSQPATQFPLSKGRALTRLLEKQCTGGRFTGSVKAGVGSVSQCHRGTFQDARDCLGILYEGT